MSSRTWFVCNILALFPIALIAVPHASGQVPKLRPKVVALEKSNAGIVPILAGPPETVSMKSGFVVLAPGHSVGKHSTLNHEEILIVLEGQGEMLFQDGAHLRLKAHTALYCPPQTEHDVKNTGSTMLRYVYVVADAR